LSGKYPLATGLEHDEMGHPTGSPKLHMEMTAAAAANCKSWRKNCRCRKSMARRKATSCWSAGVRPKAPFAKRWIAPARPATASPRNLRHISPLPPGLENIFAGFNHVIVVEMNDEGLYGYGQLAGLLRARFCLTRKSAG
jgi:2-oxoglutarate/2-oxoacid ferredoxin oxidoreductase subunit alpha